MVYWTVGPTMRPRLVVYAMDNAARRSFSLEQPHSQPIRHEIAS